MPTETKRLWNTIDRLGDKIDEEGYAGRLFWAAAEKQDLEELERILDENFQFAIPEIDSYLKEIRQCFEKLKALCQERTAYEHLPM